MRSVEVKWKDEGRKMREGGRREGEMMRRRVTGWREGRRVEESEMREKMTAKGEGKVVVRRRKDD